MPLRNNPLTTRERVQAAAAALCASVERHMSPTAARVRLGSWAASHSSVCEEMEGFCRPLWGLIALVAGGATYDCSRFREGLATGTDPQHEEFRAAPSDRDQRSVELVAILRAAVRAPRLLGAAEPNAAGESVRPLQLINRCELRDNNWLFFRVLAKLVLARVGAVVDRPSASRDLDRFRRSSVSTRRACMAVLCRARAAGAGPVGHRRPPGRGVRSGRIRRADGGRASTYEVAREANPSRTLAHGAVG